MRWDEIGEEYQKLKDRVIGWASTKAEKRGGPVPMEVGGIEDHGAEDESEDWWEVDYVYPTTKCYNCGKGGLNGEGVPGQRKGEGREGRRQRSREGKGKRMEWKRTR